MSVKTFPDSHTDHGTYLGDSLIYLLSKLLPVLASFIILAAYTRWIPAEEYGVFSTVLVVAGSLSMVSFSWLYVGIMRFWEHQHIDNQAIVRLIAYVIVLVAVLAALGSAVFAAVSGQHGVAIAFWCLFVSAALFEAWQRVHSITRQVRRYLWLETGRALLTLLLGLLLVGLGYAWQGAVAAVVLGILGVLLITGFFSCRARPITTAQETHLLQKPAGRGKLLVYKPEGELLKKLLVYGLPLSLSLVLLEIIHTADRVMISALLGYAHAGQYAVAYNLPFQLLMMLTSSLNLAAYPVVIRQLEQHGKAAAEQQLRHYFLLLMGISLPGLLGLMAVAEHFIPLLVGAEFVASSLQLLPWISVAVFANCSYLFYVSLSFQLAEQTYAALIVTVIAALLNVLLNALLIPRYGLPGAVIASIAAYAVCLVGGYYRGRRYFRLHIPFFELLKILLAAAVMWWVLQAIGVTTALIGGVFGDVLLGTGKILLGMLIYGLLIFLLNAGGIRQYLAMQWPGLILRFGWR